MHDYHDILVLPYTELLQEGQGRSTHVGGPLWPDWTASNPCRHYRYGEPVDDKPENDVEPSDIHTVDGAAYWCGPVVGHFGHQIAEFSTRLPVYAHLDDPNIKLCFGVDRGRGISKYDNFPRFLKELLGWFGIPAERVIVANAPTRFRHLYCVPQQEHLHTATPSEAYLDILDSFAKKNDCFFSDKSGTYYVSRAAMPMGRIAGESYIEYILGLSGVKVIRPEALSLREQFRIYSSAETLIFAEGSALHGMLMLGRIRCNVNVLARRPRHKLLHRLLAPRVNDLQYFDAGGLIAGYNLNGKPAPALGITVPDLDRVNQIFGAIGVDIRVSNSVLFEQMVMNDVRLWLANETRQARFRIPNAEEAVRSNLRELGLDFDELMK